MRFGTRIQQEDAELRVDGAELRTALPQRHGRAPTVSTGFQSQRLRRIGEYFAAQEDLLREMRHQVELETAPLAELLVRQQSTLQRTLQNLEERLRPVNEYADAEEANLAALEQRMQGQGMDFIARSFADYVGIQRQRIDGARQHIDEQRTPFLRFAEDQRAIVEVAIARFDDDVQALEQNLQEQRKVLMRVLDAMRSESFLSVKELLGTRESLLEEFAQAGITDPVEIATQMNALRGELALEGGGTHLQAVVSASDAADQRLSSAGPRSRTAPSPFASIAEREGVTAGRSA